MKVLMLSTDQRIFEENSEVRQRMADFGSVFDELRIIVYTKGKLHKKTAIAGNVFAYPTNTRFKLLYFWQAYKIGAGIIRNSCLPVGMGKSGIVPIPSRTRDKVGGNFAITAQDPFETGLAGWFLKLRFKIPLQIQIHTDLFSPYFRKESLKNRLKLILAEFLLPRADGIRVVSERIKRSLESNVKCQMSYVSVLPVFIDIKKMKDAKIETDLRKKYPNYDFIVLIASRIATEKNFSLVMRIASGIFIKYPRTLFLIVGGMPKNIQESLLCHHPMLKDNIIVESWTNDLVSYYKTADLFLLTSNYEGYGRTIVEAMASGLPVVMTNVGLAGEIIKDNWNGFVVPVNDSEELTRAVKMMIDDSGKRKLFIHRSREIVDNFPDKRSYLEKYRNSLNLMLK